MVRKPESRRGPQFAPQRERDLGRQPAAAAGAGARPRHVDGLLAARGVDPARAAGWRAIVADREDQEGVAARPLRADPVGEAGERGRDAGADHARQGDAAVGLDQGDLVGQEARDGGGLGDAVRLRGDEYAEGGDVEPRRAVAQRPREHPAQEGAEREGRADRPAAAVAEPVEEGADQRRHDRRTATIVRPRKSSTGPRCPLVAPAKKTVPASAIANAESPAALAACSSMQAVEAGALGALRAGCLARRPHRRAAGPAGHPGEPGHAAGGRPGGADRARPRHVTVARHLGTGGRRRRRREAAGTPHRRAAGDHRRGAARLRRCSPSLSCPTGPDATPLRLARAPPT